MGDFQKKKKKNHKNIISFKSQIVFYFTSFYHYISLFNKYALVSGVGFIEVSGTGPLPSGNLKPDKICR